MILLFLFGGSTSFQPIDNCEGNGHPGNWTCSKNEDDTLNVTLDCDLNARKVCLWLRFMFWIMFFFPNATN